MNKSEWNLFFVSIALLTGTSYAAHGSDLNSPASLQNQLATQVRGANWRSIARNSGNVALPSREAIDAFYEDRAGATWIGDKHEGAWRVCSFGFYDLTGNGDVKLVVNYNPGTRAFCNQLIILGKTGPISYIDSWAEGSQNGVQQFVQDLDGSGKFKLVVPELWSQYMGAQSCYATWTKVYDFEAGTPKDVSALFKEFYKSRLRVLDQKMQIAFEKRMHDSEFWQAARSRSVAEKVQHEGGPYSNARRFEVTDAAVHGALATDDLNVSCLAMERDRINRFLGQDPSAGLEDAEAWAKSEYPAFRSNAATVFSDIATPSALAELRKLAADKDIEVATLAKESLEQKSNRSGLNR